MDLLRHAPNYKIPRARRFEPQFVQHHPPLKTSPARPRTALIRRARPSMMVPVGQDSTAKHAIPHGRVKLPRPAARGKRWDPAWSVQAAPVNPAWVAPITRARLKAALLKHGRILQFPAAQDTRAAQARTRPRVKVPTAARGRRTQPPWTVTTPITPAFVPRPTRPRHKAWGTRRGRRFDPAWPGSALASPTICYPTSALIVSYDTAATVVNYNSEVAITSYRTAAAVTSYSTDLAIVTYTSDAKLSTCGD